MVREFCRTCGQKVKRRGFNKKGYLLVECGCCGDAEPCPFCKSRRGTVQVSGHSQCIDCNQVIESCCTGESLEIDNEAESDEL